MNFLTPTTTTQVSVSNKLIGAIMGRSGVRINQVRQESNADIKISRQEPGVEDRIITISGTPEQIQNAQFLLQMRKEIRRPDVNPFSRSIAHELYATPSRHFSSIYGSRCI
ncbi:Heterogeneous nuclear ribonucleoprotein K [Paragonimus heterotremus]|uniref:Heterogeneous nuclear ribonucleoprotein K n=1 Tax=Paragonimus heterotremus TaxID=100268 RepID=A0A8J4SY30_9TREM|nr:Heterogeneous nuclear ribonucleoprotein K [Paragonimus heterotremus]